MEVQSYYEQVYYSTKIIIVSDEEIWNNVMVSLQIQFLRSFASKWRSS